MSQQFMDRVAMDPEAEAELNRFAEAGVSGQGLAEHAFSMGLRPLRWREGEPLPTISIVWPHDSEDGIPVWDTSSD